MSKTVELSTQSTSGWHYGLSGERLAVMLEELAIKIRSGVIIPKMVKQTSINLDIDYRANRLVIQYAEKDYGEEG